MAGADDPDARARWNARYRARAGSGPPARFLTDRAPLLPGSGRALDVAGGTGRNAVWLARRGFEVTLVDVSDVAVAAAEADAARQGTEVTVVRGELAPDRLPDGRFDVILVHHYLDRALWTALPPRLAPGGVLLLCQPTVRNLERHPRPSRRWLLEIGEIPRLAARLCRDDPDLEVVEATEGWTEDDRHEGRLVVRRREAGGS